MSNMAAFALLNDIDDQLAELSKLEGYYIVTGDIPKAEDTEQAIKRLELTRVNLQSRIIPELN